MNFSRGTALRKASANIHRDDDEKLNREHLETCKDQKCFAARKRKASDYHSDSELGMTIYDRYIAQHASRTRGWFVDLLRGNLV